MDEQINTAEKEYEQYIFTTEHKKQVAQKFIECIRQDLSVHINRATGEYNEEKIKEYINHCCKLYINYSVIKEVITMTGLKQNIIDQPEFSSLGEIITLAREFALYHEILSLESTPEGKDSWEGMLNNLSQLIGLDIGVLNGNNHINLGICGVNQEINEYLMLDLYDYEDIHTIPDYFNPYEDEGEFKAEKYIGNGIGEYNYDNKKLRILSSSIVQALKNPNDTEKACNLIIDLIYGDADGDGLFGVEFNPLGINHRIAFLYFIKKPSIKNEVKKIINSRMKDSEQTEEEIEEDLYNDIWNRNFSPISRTSLTYDDYIEIEKKKSESDKWDRSKRKDDSTQQLMIKKTISWKNNLYSLENLIGSILDCVNNYIDVYYGTDSDNKRDIDFIGYYDEGINKKDDASTANSNSSGEDKTTNIVAKKKNNKAPTYLFKYVPEVGNIHRLQVDMLDQMYSDLSWYSSRLPKRIGIVYPLCVKRDESDIISMISELSAHYRKAFYATNKQSLCCTESLYNATATVKRLLNDKKLVLKALKKKLKMEGKSLNQDDIQQLQIEIDTISNQVNGLQEYSDRINTLKKLWFTDKQQWIIKYREEIKHITDLVFNNAVNALILERNSKIKELTSIHNQEVDAINANRSETPSDEEIQKLIEAIGVVSNKYDTEIRAEFKKCDEKIDKTLETIYDPLELFICQSARYPGQLKVIQAALLKIEDHIILLEKGKIRSSKMPHVITICPYYKEIELEESKLNQKKQSED